MLQWVGEGEIHSCTLLIYFAHYSLEVMENKKKIYLHKFIYSSEEHFCGSTKFPQNNVMQIIVGVRELWSDDGDTQTNELIDRHTIF